MKFSFVLIVLIFCQTSLSAEEKAEEFPQLPIFFISEYGNNNILTATLDAGVANFRLKYDIAETFTDRVDASFRVIGTGAGCLRSPFLLGMGGVPQKRKADEHLYGHFLERHEEVYLQLHYLTSHNSIRGFVPLMVQSGDKRLVPSIEIERLVLLEPARNIALVLRGKLDQNETDLGVGAIGHIGHHLKIGLYTNDPNFTVGCTLELTGFFGR